MGGGVDRQSALTSVDRHLSLGRNQQQATATNMSSIEQQQQQTQMEIDDSNACTTLTLHDSEKAKYLSKPMDELSSAVSSNGCDGCGNKEPTAFYSICGHRHHHLGNCCSRDKSKWFKTVSDRRGDHKRCPVAGCTGEALDKPVFEAKYSALAIAARKACEYELHEAISAEIRAKDRDERNKKAPSRKRKADVIADEGLEAWESKQSAKKARAAGRKEKAATDAFNAKFVDQQEAKLIELMGEDAYATWRAAVTAPAVGEAGPSSAGASAAPIDEDLFGECGECDEEM